MPETQSPSPMEISGCAPADLCQAFSDVLIDLKDVDADDYCNPMLCSEYVKEIYKYLQQVEVWFCTMCDFLCWLPWCLAGRPF